MKPAIEIGGVLLGVLFAGLGWPMAAGKVKPNDLYGVRTPKTRSDETVWYEANRVGGYGMMALGAVVVVAALVLGSFLEMPLYLLGLVLVMMLTLLIVVFVTLRPYL